MFIDWFSVRFELAGDEVAQKLAALWRKVLVIADPEPIVHQHRLCCYGYACHVQQQSASLMLNLRQDLQQLHIQLGEASAVMPLDRRSTSLYLPASFWQLSIVKQRAFILTIILECLRADGYIVVHGNGLISPTRQGILFLGDSGQGKSTLCLALVQQGWSYLPDDVLLVNKPAETITVRGIRRGYATTIKTLRHLGLQDAERMFSMPEREKLVVDIGAEALSPSLNTLCPKVLMFPSIKRHATTSLSRLNRREMFTRLASQSPGLLAKDAYGQGQAELLAEIVKTTEAFDLQLGDDVFNDPQGLSQRLQAI